MIKAYKECVYTLFHNPQLKPVTNIPMKQLTSRPSHPAPPVIETAPPIHQINEIEDKPQLNSAHDTELWHKSYRKLYAQLNDLMHQHIKTTFTCTQWNQTRKNVSRIKINDKYHSILTAPYALPERHYKIDRQRGFINDAVDSALKQAIQALNEHLALPIAKEILAYSRSNQPYIEQEQKQRQEIALNEDRANRLGGSLMLT